MEHVISEPDNFMSDGGCTQSLPTRPAYPEFALADDTIVNTNGFAKTLSLCPQ